jgi:DNA helicase-2/ATP-dependent DNA helicase PcrA
MTDFLSQLNPQQREAVLAGDGPLLILAGAGSGKTRVIAHRIAYLIAERAIWPRNVLAVTFTNKAAEEMRTRVGKLLAGLDIGSVPLISTFHSLCVRILRRDIEALNAGYTRSFTIYDQDDTVRLTRNCMREIGIDDKQLAPRSVQAAISAAKNRGEDAEAFSAKAQYVDERRASIARVFQLYEERLHKNNALDFDDLLIKTVRLLRDIPDVRERYNDRFKYLLVDEYQDTNQLQFGLIRLLTEKQENICVVGDPDQSIYRWRGADITNILKFEEHYRSTQNILDLASGVIKHNVERKEKALWTQNPAGEKIRYYQALDAEMEARFVAAKIQEHLRADADLRAAVLYRTNSQSRVFEEAMRRAGLAYNIVGGFSFYERMEVRDIIAYLKLAMNAHDSIALQRVINTPTRGIGKTTLDAVETRAREFGVSYWAAISDLIEHERQLSARAVAALANFQRVVNGLAAKVQRITSATENEEANNDEGARSATEEGSDDYESSAPVSDLVKAAILDTGYENALKSENNEEAETRLENLQELVNAAVDYDENGAQGLRDFIDHSALVADTDQYKANVQVTLMTAHSAKGLEFPLVFIVGLEDGLFPHSRSLSDASDIEEERRLCYVAMTRAERFLYVTHAVKRRVYGEELASEPSQFLNEMPLDLIEDLSHGRSWLSFARGSSAVDDGAHLVAHRETKARAKYEGKTYDSAQSISDFFKDRSARMGNQVPSSVSRIQSQKAPAAPSQTADSQWAPGSYVRHAKYGRGLVLRREGSGDQIKLTVSFPGYGQKKLVEKYAGLEKA